MSLIMAWSLRGVRRAPRHSRSECAPGARLLRFARNDGGLQ
jgi:hypothetical protein